MASNPRNLEERKKKLKKKNETNFIGPYIHFNRNMCDWEFYARAKKFKLVM